MENWLRSRDTQAAETGRTRNLVVVGGVEDARILGRARPGPCGVPFPSATTAPSWPCRSCPRGTTKKVPDRKHRYRPRKRSAPQPALDLCGSYDMIRTPLSRVAPDSGNTRGGRLSRVQVPQDSRGDALAVRLAQDARREGSEMLATHLYRVAGGRGDGEQRTGPRLRSGAESATSPAVRRPWRGALLQADVSGTSRIHRCRTAVLQSRPRMASPRGGVPIRPDNHGEQRCETRPRNCTQGGIPAGQKLCRHPSAVASQAEGSGAVSTGQPSCPARVHGTGVTVETGRGQLGTRA